MLEQETKTAAENLDQDVRAMAVEVVFFDEDERPSKAQQLSVNSLLSPLRGPIFRTSLIKR